MCKWFGVLGRGANEKVVCEAGSRKEIKQAILDYKRKHQITPRRRKHLSNGK
jgi:hypothetical protein